MRQDLYCRSLVIASTLAASLASAQTGQDNLAAGKLEGDARPPLNRFGLSYRIGFNISARFRNLGGFPALSNPGTTPNGDPWNYDNGYVFEDIQGNNSALTWYWGYNGQPSKAAQVPGDGFLHLSRSTSASDVSSGAHRDDPQQPGFELTYNRELGRSGKRSWGIEGALNYLNVSISDNQTLLGTVTVQTDAYALNGVVPPDPPYFGTFEGPVPNGPNRPVISQDPTPGQGTLTTAPGGASIAGERKLEANVYGLRVGPYLDLPISTKLSAGLSGGLALAYLNSKFTFSETVTIPGVGSVPRSGSNSHTELLVGGYAAGTLAYSFSKAWSASVGAQYQILGRSSQTVNGKIAELDLRNSIFVTVGIGYSF